MSISRIAVDLDDTLADFIGPFLRYYNLRVGSNFRKEDFNTYELYDVLGITEGKKSKVIADFCRTNVFKKLPVLDGSVEGVREIGKGNELYVVTSRRHSTAGTTKRWVNRNFNGRFNEIYTTNGYKKKSLSKAYIAHKIGCSMAIEDNGEQAYSMAEKGIEVVLLTKPWNLGVAHSKITRVKNWEEIADYCQNGCFKR